MFLPYYIIYLTVFNTLLYIRDISINYEFRTTKFDGFLKIVRYIFGPPKFRSKLIYDTITRKNGGFRKIHHIFSDRQNFGLRKLVLYKSINMSCEVFNSIDDSKILIIHIYRSGKSESDRITERAAKK